MSTYKTKKSATAAAKKALGGDAINTVDFWIVENDSGRFEWTTADPTALHNGDDEVPAKDVHADTAEEPAEDAPADDAGTDAPGDDATVASDAEAPSYDAALDALLADVDAVADGLESGEIKAVQKTATKTAKAKKEPATAPRANTKQRIIWDLCARPEGATADEINEATGYTYGSYRIDLVNATKRYGGAFVIDHVEVEGKSRPVQRYRLFPAGTEAPEGAVSGDEGRAAKKAAGEDADATSDDDSHAEAAE